MIWKLIFDVLSFYKEHRIRGGPEYIGSAVYFYRYYICAFMTTFRYSHLNVFIYFLIFGIVLNQSHLALPLMQECGSLLSAKVIVDFLVIVVSQALIARTITITAIDYVDRTIQNALECTSIIGHNSTNMASAASNSIVEHERIKH